MRKIIYPFFAAILVALSVDINAQEVADSVFFLNGNVDVVRIIKNSSEEIDCNYPNEDMITTISKSKIAKIVFRSGRVEFCNEALIVGEEKLDEIYLTNGEMISAKITRITDDSIEYEIPGQGFSRNTYATLLNKIIFADGREELFGNLLNIKVITSESQWEDVVITYNASDLRGLERVGEISKVSGFGGTLATGKGYNDSIKKIKKEAAKMGCGLVYITDAPNRLTTGQGSGVRVNAIAYRIRQSETDNVIEVYPEDLSDLARSFADGSINQLSHSKAIDAAVDLCNEILKDIDDDLMNEAKIKFLVLSQWYNGDNEKKHPRVDNLLTRIAKKIYE